MMDTPLGTLMVKRARSVDPSKFPDEEFDLYSIPAYDRGAPEVLTGAGIGSSKQIVAPGDVLLSRIVPHIRRAWIVGPNRGRRIIASGEWIVFRSDAIDPRWLRHYLLADVFHMQFMQTVAGVGGSLLRARPAQVSTISLAVPPLDEQRRIAAILDRADSLRCHRRELLVALKNLKQAIFASMLAGYSATGKLGDYGEIQGGLQVSRKRGELPVERPYLRVANVYRGALVLREVKTIRVTEAEAQRAQLQRGDLLFVEGHANADEVGRVAEWDGSISDCLHQNHLIRVRLNSSKVEPTYAEAWFNSYQGSMHFRRSGKTTSGLNTINASQLRAAPMPVPPISLQRKYVQAARAVDAQVRERGVLGELTDELFASLQSRAFSGQL